MLLGALCYLIAVLVTRCFMYFVGADSLPMEERLMESLLSGILVFFVLIFFSKS